MKNLLQAYILEVAFSQKNIMSDRENERKVILSKVKGLVDMIALPTATWLANSKLEQNM